tara:strand:- start:4271 stop:4882 length:612 start_codon:yes stop_codon:yes gene_type:complete
MALSVNDFTAGTAITASAMNANFASIENYVNSSPGMAALTGATFSGLITANGGLTAGGTLSFTGAAVFTSTVYVGVDGTGHDVILYGDTSGDYMSWDADTNKLIIVGTASTTALDVQEGNVVIDDNLTVTNGAFTVTNGASSIKNLAFTGTLSGTNSVPRVAYNAGGVATVASNQLDANPTLFVCPAAVAPNALAAGDIWFAL